MFLGPVLEKKESEQNGVTQGAENVKNSLVKQKCKMRQCQNGSRPVQNRSFLKGALNPEGPLSSQKLLQIATR